PVLDGDGGDGGVQHEQACGACQHGAESSLFCRSGLARDGVLIGTEALHRGQARSHRVKVFLASGARPASASSYFFQSIHEIT
ncbi:MAG: hypothetical protein KBF22_10045, partial [Ottowia sp.]|nr:hypothetical protein [Ottowia sp.]